MKTPSPPETGQMNWLYDDVRSVLAPNPSPMTYWGTNSFIIGRGEVALLDPGPADSNHVAALLQALEPGEKITDIVLTHSHLDHSAAVPMLVKATGARILAYGDSNAGQRSDVRALSGIGGGEGRDRALKPDLCLKDGEVFGGDNWSLKAIWTPGHMGNHMCFALRDTLFTGDHVMGWATSMVSPPDGDLTDFMLSLEKLMGHGFQQFLPAHGAAISQPEDRLQELFHHRKGREEQILSALSTNPSSARDLAYRIYTDIPDALIPAATRNVLAHLIDLTRRSLTSTPDQITENSVFSLV